MTTKQKLLVTTRYHAAGAPAIWSRHEGYAMAAVVWKENGHERRLLYAPEYAVRVRDMINALGRSIGNYGLPER